MQENRCFKCKQVGHRLSECRKRKRESEFQPALNHLKGINPGSQFKPRLPEGLPAKLNRGKSAHRKQNLMKHHQNMTFEIVCPTCMVESK